MKIRPRLFCSATSSRLPQACGLRIGRRWFAAPAVKTSAGVDLNHLRYEKIEILWKSFFSDFNQIIDNSFKSKNKSNKGTPAKKDSDFINQIQQLNELYKSGVLSKDEFEKAKKKILN